MCEHGQEVICRVWIGAIDSHDGSGHWASKGIDACLAHRVNALNARGHYTRSCCCGHGKGGGVILLHDGTTIAVRSRPILSARGHRTGAQGRCGMDAQRRERANAREKRCNRAMCEYVPPPKVLSEK